MNNKDKIQQAKHILKIIEGCTPDIGQEVYDEVNARWWCCLKDKAYHGTDGRGRFSYNLHYPLSMRHPRKRINKDESYTHSRDALKQARPEGWEVVQEACMGNKVEFTLFQQWALADTGDYDSIKFTSPQLPTEELAELHAIIQAWIYIWENEG